MVGENLPRILYKKVEDKSVQAFVADQFRSKAIQANVQLMDQALSPTKLPLTSSVIYSI
ncbi:hypothetical protein HHI36_008288, partial [Cryptolaemus montrouzieri]